MTSAERAKDQRLQKIYKITLEEQNANKASQNNACACCGRDFDHYTAFQDHLHKCCPRRLKEFCGKCNRGLLCYTCNKFVVGILERGQPLPPLALLARLVAYFEKWEPILKAKGCYDEKPKVKATVRRKKKSV
jgi:Recombination endonuclease VII